MRDEKHGLPACIPDILKLDGHPFARHRIQSREGFVHKQKPGIVNESAGNADALLHTA